MTLLVHSSPRKHPQKENPTLQEKGKVADLEPREDSEEINTGGDDIDMGVEDVDVEGSDLISKLPKYIPPRRGKANIPKGIDESKVTLHTPLLQNNITFHRPCLAHIPLLNLEDWDLGDTKHFPHLAIDQFMHRVFHKDNCVTTIEPRKWIKGVDKGRTTK